MAETAVPIRSLADEVWDYMVANPKSTPVMVRGRGAEIEDEEGRTYLDFEGGPGVNSVGHCHPAVVAAIQKQAATLIQSPGRFHSRLAFELAKRISLLTDGHLRRVFFVNSGAEANDGAVKLALKYATLKGKKGFGIVAFEHGFHGRLSLPLALTGIPAIKKGFGPYASFPGVLHITPPYFYRCPFGSRTSEECGDRAAQALRDALKWRVPGEAALMIAEPILGLSGVIVPPDNYWPQVEEICAESNVTLVMDEVFVGFGRTGKAFAHQHWNVRPSIVTFAKAIGGGLPLGGFIATPELASSFEANDHNTTFGANSQVGLAAAHAVLDVLDKEKLAERAGVAGETLMDGFRRLQSKFGFVGDVRGRGLVLGIEVVKDRHSKTPEAQLAKTLQASLRNHGLILGLSGVHGNVLRMSPALTLSDNQIEQSLAIFERSFAMV
jgi:4-aminobutyrate aminotransferase / (S)-3-amino-2-methylpropionate transaminase / 5-aminovalerate transaminase